MRMKGIKKKQRNKIKTWSGIEPHHQEQRKRAENDNTKHKAPPLSMRYQCFRIEIFLALLALSIF